jgi:hypothetical protein
MNQHKKTEREVIEDAYEELKNGSPLIKLSIDLGIPSSTLRSKVFSNIICLLNQNL